MTSQRIAWAAAAIGVSALVAGCGAGQTTSGSTPVAATSAASGPTSGGATSPPSSMTQLPNTASTGITSAGLPTVGHGYGELLLKAWATGDRTQAARYATPDAVLALFNHTPVKGLVNFECGDQNPMLCGWIGSGDTQVILAFEPKRLAEGATQAVVAASVKPA
ncbi:MAG: hypothetical protein IPI32_08335 [Austwickia sp.]|nr:hypothetical protein [Austwickia sp.]MBK8436510.1 hypothetical protein [Austwickia sp.]MBK9102188.1 hypothetical protein [Austwickia sp.]